MIGADRIPVAQSVARIVWPPRWCIQVLDIAGSESPMQDDIVALARAVWAQENGHVISDEEAERLERLRPRLDAAAQGDVAKLHEWVSAENVDEADEDGASCLFAAAFHGHTAAITLLIAKGASVNRESLHGTTALWSAINNAQDAAIRLLIDAGMCPCACCCVRAVVLGRHLHVAAPPSRR